MGNNVNRILRCKFIRKTINFFACTNFEKKSLTKLFVILAKTATLFILRVFLYAHEYDCHYTHYVVSVHWAPHGILSKKFTSKHCWMCDQFIIEFLLTNNGGADFFFLGGREGKADQPGEIYLKNVSVNFSTYEYWDSSWSIFVPFGRIFEFWGIFWRGQIFFRSDQFVGWGGQEVLWPPWNP